MNERMTLSPQACGAAIETGDVRLALKRLLASAQFARAPSMSRLLSFLVEKKLGGMEREINEYAIGLDVFRRDASMYTTMLDPVVRVQVGRLRARLAAYYVALPRPPAIRISIPMGNYIPLFALPSAAPRSFRYRLLQVAPLRNLTAEQGSSAFVCGLDEELGSRLFTAFGGAIELRETEPAPALGDAGDQEPPHRLEGSIRVEDKHVRASMRLVDTRAGHIAWLSKFDFSGALCMSLQEKLAGAICAELERHLVEF